MAKRIKGGDKNEKSGTVWTKIELEKVLDLYFKLEGKGLHERNPEIISLGQGLERTTRSVEAQLLMFRNKERSGAYGFKKMNHLVDEVWQERKLNKKIMVSSISKGDQLEELFNWFGHRKGGVKIAFTDRGKPTGNVIQTDLILAIDNWASQVSNPDRCSLKVFFVGGPGNGKTEALDYAVRKVIQQYNLSNDILEKIESQAKESKRTVEVDVNSDNVPFKKIILVQDASLGYTSGGAARAMLDDYVTIADNSILFICCINRGILQDVISLSKLEKKENELELFLQLAQYMDTTGEVIQNTWPIPVKLGEIKLPFSIWPMEVSSLFESNLSHGQILSPFEQVVKLAVANLGWQSLKDFYVTEELNSAYCPLLNNLSILKSNSGSNVKAFINEYELLSNRRLTFREMLSLTVYLLLGHENDFRIDDSHVSITDFTSKNIGHLRDQIDADESCFRLAMLQLEFKFFNSWPDITQIVNDPTWKRFLDQSVRKGELMSCEAFIKIFTKPIDVVNRTDLEKTLHHLNSLLDPGKLYRDEDYNDEFNPSHIDLFLQDSVETLKKSITSFMALSDIDREVLSFFVRVENELDRIRAVNNINSINSTVERLNFILKKITASYVKRKLGGRYGISSETTNIKKYKEFDGTNTNLRSVIDELLGIDYKLNHMGSHLGVIDIAINSTFGQPDFSEQDVRYRSNIFYSVSIYRPKGENIQQPINDSRSLKLTISHVNGDSKSFHIPLTYHLYNAITDIKSGLKKGTMPRDIAATFDRMKSFMEGISVHREVNDSFLVFPSTKEIEIVKIFK